MRLPYSRQKSIFLQGTSSRQSFPGNASSALNNLLSNSICSFGQSIQALTCISFEFGDLAIVGASPETLLTVHKRTVIINPIAGTCPRGKSEAEDEAFASHMLNDEKERAEHVMLVDLGRNDVRMVAESGSVKVSGFMEVLKYSHVQHIESTVSGTLRPECDQFDAFRAVFPAGTLSGAPKIRAMEIISELEASPRGNLRRGSRVLQLERGRRFCDRDPYSACTGQESVSAGRGRNCS